VIDRPPVLRDEPAAGIARLRLNRPERRNAFDAELREALDSELAAVLSDDAVRAVLLCGDPTIFSGGGDLVSMADLDASSALARMRAGHRLVRRLAAAEKPIVGAAAGWAVGASIGLLLLCDSLIGGRSLRFVFPFMRLALVPDWGIAATLPSRVGVARARQLLLHSRTVEAEEAAAIGLLDELVDDDELDARGVERAVALAHLPRHAFALTKRLLNEAALLDTTLELEAAAQALSLVSADAREGRAAFLEKRQPTF
jgi:2-(1,2-epoxy-1,2-dihydrophenyl)acetyl-CoA isomerase